MYKRQEFIVALGYKSEVIKRYFHDYYCMNGDITIDPVSYTHLDVYKRQGSRSCGQLAELIKNRWLKF